MPGEAELSAMKRLIAVVLDPLREALGPVFVSSMYRSALVNLAVRGSRRSQHMSGEAADVVVPGVSNYDVAAWITQNVPFDQLILEYVSDDGEEGWVHVSFREGGGRHEIRTRDDGVPGYPLISEHALMEMADVARHQRG